MNDRELLELSAKAAGIDLEHRDDERPGYYFTHWTGFAQWQDWNPLEDDGAALRLAVKLRLGVAVFLQGVRVLDFSDANWEKTLAWEPSNDHDADDYAALTRRAIVRAAAYIGEGMP